MPPIATGQFTIIDYNDALSITGFISANQPKTQLYNPDTGEFNPDYTQNNMILTASLFKIGSGADIINSAKSISWAKGDGTALSGTTTDYTVSGKTLTIKTNVLASVPAIDYICTVVYTDPTTNLDLTYKMSISLSKVVNGGGIVNAIAWAPNGNIFKNGTGSLIAECTLRRGTGVIDETNVTYQWYKFAGGTWTAISGANSKQLAVTPDMVPNIETFKCEITDNDPASNTYGQKFSDTITFVDQTDPIQVVVISSAGNIFKNGSGSTTLTAKLYQSGEEIDSAGTAYNYTWTKRDKNGNPASFASGGSTKTGKTLAVGDNDVDGMATFEVDVTNK